MMATYIPKETALKVVEKYGTTSGFALGRHTGLAICIASEIAEIPAADVTPVVHGRWGNNGIPGSMLCGCSVCGFTCGASSFFYCPNCGSKMDGEP